MTSTLYLGDCLDILPTLTENSIDAIVTDPPAGIFFMSKSWDHDKGGRNAWIAWMTQVAAECLRVLKPGGYALVWALPRTSHWTATAWEDGGFEVRDRIAYVSGSGFPKSLDVSKAIDKMNGRKFEDRYALGRHIREQREAHGLSRADVNKILSSVTKCEHYESDSPEFARIPSLADWDILQPKLGLSDNWREMIQRTEAEREIIGNGKSGKTAIWQDGGMGNFNITAPATDAAREWAGWGTALKPAVEDWWIFRKPLSEKTIAANVLRWGTGCLNIDQCRIENAPRTTHKRGNVIGNRDGATGIMMGNEGFEYPGASGRWPAHLLLDGSPEVVAMFPQAKSSGIYPGNGKKKERYGIISFKTQPEDSDRPTVMYDDTGSAARFFKSCPMDADDYAAEYCVPPLFYCAKASKRDRDEGCEGMEAKQYSHDGRITPIENAYQRNDSKARNHHPTVKPTSLMRYLCRLVTPPGGIDLDPFAGSGSTIKGAILEGFDCIGIESDKEYFEIMQARAAEAEAQVTARLIP